jgi:hypothetical protein
MEYGRSLQVPIQTKSLGCGTLLGEYAVLQNHFPRIGDRN